MAWLPAWAENLTGWILPEPKPAPPPVPELSPREQLAELDGQVVAFRQAALEARERLRKFDTEHHSANCAALSVMSKGVLLYRNSVERVKLLESDTAAWERFWNALHVRTEFLKAHRQEAR